MKAKKWYQKSYRRNLVDMHIDDWNEEFLSKLNVKAYVGLLKKANVQTAMIYANSHVGLCYWPTTHARMHRGLKGEDFLGEMIQLCHAQGMDVVVYFSLIYDNWAYDHDPDWRIINEFGCNSREKSEKIMFSGERYGTCCPNNVGYRDYVRKQVRELCEMYSFEGIFFDMLFWPSVCYCPSCKARFEAETGMQIPEILDWTDASWLRFQQKREEWMSEFAEFITHTVREVTPGVTVEHQFSPASHSWRWGVTDGICKASDYAGGDFYGGASQQSFICKLYHSLTLNEPFEYMTSRCDPDLYFHTNTKSKEALELHTYLALAHNGAFLFIDAIDPDGIVQPELYQTMGEIFSESARYEKFLGGKLCRDVAIYFSLTSKIDLQYNGTLVSQLKETGEFPHLKAALTAAETMIWHHIPFDVVSKRNLGEIGDCAVLVLPDVRLIDDEEAEKICAFVEHGGSLYVSGYADHPMISKLIGIQYCGETKEKITYLAPNGKGGALFPGIDVSAPLAIKGSQHIVRTEHPEDVRATVTLPYTDPADTTHFASIHTNPPGVTTNHAAAIERKYGKGKVLWLAAPIEAMESTATRQAFAHLVKTLAEKPLFFVSDAPAPVEILVFHQEEHKRFVVHLVNEQEKYPQIIAQNIRLAVKLNGRKAISANILQHGQEIKLAQEGGYAHIEIPRLKTYCMAQIKYE
jgi:hypothetical protein